MTDGAQGAHLVFVSGPEDGRELRRKLPLVLGRLSENEVPLQYDYLSSRRHARLSHDGTAFVLEDLGSRNGTFLNTLPARNTKIHAGDEIRAGVNRFKIEQRA